MKYLLRPVKIFVGSILLCYGCLLAWNLPTGLSRRVLVGTIVTVCVSWIIGLGIFLHDSKGDWRRLVRFVIALLLVNWGVFSISRMIMAAPAQKVDSIIASVLFSFALAFTLLWTERARSQG